MIGLIIALVLALGVGGTAVVADNARPGDALFGIDQTVENMRLKLAGDEKESELRIKFAEERVAEIEDLMAEEDENAETIDASIEAEDAEKVKPEESLSKEDEEDVNMGIEAALNLLSGLEATEGENAELDSLVERLNSYLNALPANAKIEVSDDKLKIEFQDEDEEIKLKTDEEKGKLKAEIRTEEGRIKVEVKDGVLEIKSKLDADNDVDEGGVTVKMGGLEEAEAEIFSDKTIVEVEIGDEKTTFATSANTREGIIAAIVAKFPTLSAEQVGAVLKLESEDEADDDEDKDSDDGKDDEEDEGPSDDNDESNSGSDSGRD